MGYPNLQNINLPVCCQNRIEDINRKLKLSNYLQPILCVGTLVNIFGPSPHPINSIVSIQQTDYVALSEALKAVPILTRKIVFDECQRGQLRHINNDKLSKFWEGMADAFR